MLQNAISLLEIINVVICAVFVFCYSYQFIYIPIAIFAKQKPHKETKLHKLAVLICAHNEEKVVGNLIDSLTAQDYPADSRAIFVMADNCKDTTAEVAQAHGATAVFERHDAEHIGKGYALHALLTSIDEAYGKDAYDAFVVFDADNLAEPNFLTEINKTFSDGYEIVTTYRNSKNYGDSWVSAGSGMWFIRDCKYLNGARSAIGGSSVLAGTGFLFSNKIKQECGGWPFHCLTEDTEFMIHNVLKGYIVGYAPDAVFYDEQPTRFRDSWNQRIRWAKGGLQVFGKYFGGLLRGIFSKKFLTCYDFSMSVAPAYFLSLISVFVNIARIVLCLIAGQGAAALTVAGQILLGLYGMVFIISAVATVTEWKKINASAAKKIWYAFTFPLFMMTYVPICFLAIFVKVKWKSIPHKDGESLADVHAKKDELAK